MGLIYHKVSLAERESDGEMKLDPHACRGRSRQPRPAQPSGGRCTWRGKSEELEEADCKGLASCGGLRAHLVCLCVISTGPLEVHLIKGFHLGGIGEQRHSF